MANNTSAIALALVALLAGVMLGVLGARVLHLPNGATTDASTGAVTTQTAAADFRVAWNRLWLSQHRLEQNALVSIYEDRDDRAQTKAALEQVATESAAILETVEEEAVVEEWETLWGQRSDSMVAYAQAAAVEDAQGMETASQELEEHADQMAEFITSNFEGAEVSQEELIEASRSRHEAAIQAFNAYGAGNYEEAYEQREAATTAAEDLADLVSEALVSARPDMF